MSDDALQKNPTHWEAATYRALVVSMIALKPEHVVPSHTRPVLGVRASAAALTAYHDGLKSVVDQTVEGIRKGERPDELAADVKLPPALVALR